MREGWVELGNLSRGRGHSRSCPLPTSHPSCCFWVSTRLSSSWISHQIQRPAPDALGQPFRGADAEQPGRGCLLGAAGPPLSPGTFFPQGGSAQGEPGCPQHLRLLAQPTRPVQGSRCRVPSWFSASWSPSSPVIPEAGLNLSLDSSTNHEAGDSWPQGQGTRGVWQRFPGLRIGPLRLSRMCQVHPSACSSPSCSASSPTPG